MDKEQEIRKQNIGIPDPWSLYLRLKSSPDHMEDGVWRYTEVDPALLLETLVYLDYKVSEDNG